MARRCKKVEWTKAATPVSRPKSRPLLPSWHHQTSPPSATPIATATFRSPRHALTVPEGRHERMAEVENVKTGPE